MRCKYEGTGVWNGRCTGTKEVDPCVGYEKCKNYKPNTKTNADRIRAMSDEELAGFIEAMAFKRDTPWATPFAQTFCKECPSVVGVVEETKQKLHLHECDFSDGICPHGSDIVWWLQQPGEEVPRNG